MFDAVVGDLLEMTSSELDAVIAEEELAKRASEARLAAAVAVVDARGSYRDGGHSSVQSYLKATLNCSGSTANRIRHRAATLNEHAVVGDALASGRIGVDQVDGLARARKHPRAGHRFGEFLPLLLDDAEQLEFRDFDVVVNHFIDQADPDGAFDDQQFHETQRTATVHDRDGHIEVHASGGDPLAAAEMAKIFELAVSEEFERDAQARRDGFGDAALEHPLPRTAAQRRFDAMHAIFMSWATAPAEGVTPEPLVNIVFDHVSFGEVLSAHGMADEPNLFGQPDESFAAASGRLDRRRCHTSTGSSVHPDVALEALVRGRVRRVVLDAQSVVIDMGRTQRLFTGKARDAAQLLATTCSHRGCDIPATQCDVDHRAEWVRDGGETNQANASPACGPHDRWKHRNKIRSRRAVNGRTYLVRPDGKTILPVGAREPEWAEPPPTGSRWELPVDDLDDDWPDEFDLVEDWDDFDPSITIDQMPLTITRGPGPMYVYENGELRPAVA